MPIGQAKGFYRNPAGLILRRDLCSLEAVLELASDGPCVHACCPTHGPGDSSQEREPVQQLSLRETKQAGDGQRGSHFETMLAGTVQIRGELQGLKGTSQAYGYAREALVRKENIRAVADHQPWCSTREYQEDQVI